MSSEMQPDRSAVSFEYEIVDHIRTLLLEQYKMDSSGMTLLKELIQNADDARATSLGFGYSFGIATAKHPLLQCPAFFAINNGPFSEKNDKGIRQFGPYAKAEDTESIGRFGLGMKSVFHWCETFVYLDSSGKFARLVNPWKDKHKDWNQLWNENVNQDVGSLVSHLSRIVDEFKSISDHDHWFLLWLPLRKKAHFCDDGIPIVSRTPDMEPKEILSSPSTAQQLGELFPLLQSLREIRGWIANQNSPDDFNAVMHLQISKESRRAQPVMELEVGNHTISGSILNKDRTANSFAGQVEKLSCKELIELTEHEEWKRSSKTGIEKVIQHAAVYFSAIPDSENDNAKTNKRRPKLSMKFSMFLPLGETKVEQMAEVSVFFHGYFFVDTGRNEVKGLLNKDKLNLETVDYPQQLVDLWNIRLLEEGVLPLFLPALADFAEKWKVENKIQKLELLTRAIKEDVFWKSMHEDSRKVRYRQWNWICRYRVDDNGKSSLSWGLEDVNKPFYRIPKSDRVDIPLHVFPDLEVISRNKAIVFVGNATLAAQDDKPLPDDDIVTMLRGVQAENVLQNSDHCSYLEDFIRSNATHCTDQRVFATLWNRMLFHYPEFKERKKLQRLLLERIPSNLKFRSQHLNESLLKELLTGDINKIEKCKLAMVPAELSEENDTASETLPQSDVSLLIELLAGMKKTSDVDGLIADIIKACPGIFANNSNLRHLKLFTWFNCRTGKEEEKLDFETVQNTDDEHRVFSEGKEYAKAMEEAVSMRGRQPFVVLGRISTLALEKTKRCDPNSLLDWFRSNNIELAPPEKRHGLFDKIRSTNHIDELCRKLLRFLLHGNREKIDDLETPLFVNPPEKKDLWQKIVMKLCKIQDENWRIIDSDWCDFIREFAGHLRVGEMDTNMALKMLEQIPSSENIFMNWKPTKEEYCILMEQLAEKGLGATAKRLPIHPLHDKKNEFVSIDGNTFVAPNIKNLDGKLIPPETRFIDRWLKPEIYRKLETPAWDEAKIVEKILELNKEGEHCRYLLSHWKKTLTEPQKNDLLQRKWIPLVKKKGKDEVHVSVKEIIGESAWKSAVEECKSLIWENDVHEDFLKDSSYQEYIAPKVSKGMEAIDILAVTLPSDPQYHIGLVPSDLKEWLELFSEIDPIAMPAVKLLKMLHSEDEEWAKKLFSALRQEISIEQKTRIFSILRHLTTIKYCKNIKDLFIDYLKPVLEINNYQQLLKGDDAVKLLNQDEKWCLPKNLANHDASGVRSESRLHGDMQFVEKIVNCDRSKKADEEKNSQKPVPWIPETYFEKMKISHFSELVGAFLALFGDTFKEESNNYLRERNPDNSQETVYDILKLNDHQATLQNTTLSAKIAQNNDFIPNIFGEKDDTIQSLTSLDNNSHDMFVGNLVIKDEVVEIKFAEAARVSQVDLGDLFYNTAHKYCYDVLEVEIPREPWLKWAQGDQADIDVAQKLFIEEADGIVQSLACDNEKIEQWCRELGKLKLALAEQNSSKMYTEKKTVTNDDIQRKREEIVQLLADDSVHEALLKSLRHRIENHYSYSLASVPFELFQNADDACVQLSDEKSHFQDSPESFMCEIVTDKESLTFRHNGREINRFSLSGGDNHISECKRDLACMLTMGLSPKGGKEMKTTTGKFGLGFKSVFLICDEPRIISDRLRFAVRGGLYPEYLVDKDYQELYEKFSKEKKRRTIMNFRFRDEISRDEVLENFRKFLPILLVFAKKIHKCLIDGTFFEWGPNRNIVIKGIEPGTHYRKVKKERKEDKEQYLVFRCHNGNVNGNLLLRIQNNEIVKFDKDVPSIWATTPSKMTLDVGFLVNSSLFQVDTGRSHVEPNLPNIELMRELGVDVGKKLLSLWTEHEDSRHVSGVFTDKNQGQRFWGSLWKILGVEFVKFCQRNTNKEKDFFVALLWKDKNSAAAALYLSGKKTIPSGFGDHFVAIGDIKFFLDGMLGKVGKTVFTFDRESKWDSQFGYSSQNTVQHDVVNTLKTFNAFQIAEPCCDEPTPVRLLDILEKEIGKDKLITPELAERWGKIFFDCIHPQEKITLWNLPDFEKEKEGILKILTNTIFYDENDVPQQVRNLVVGHGSDSQHSDERDRAKFAPSNAILHEKYGTQYALMFFFDACRQGKAPDTPKNIEWILNADDEKRQAVIEYLLLDYPGMKLLPGLRNNLGWLERLPDTKYWEELPFQDRAKLATNLERSFWIEPFSPVVEHDDYPEFVTIDARKTLRQISDWWKCELGKKIALEKYLNRIYPKHIDMESLHNDDNRRAWVTLFLLGISHTIGRAQPEQHRGFLNKCEENGWLDVFAASEYDSRKWMSVIEEYINGPDQQEYMQWMKNFVSIYAVSRFLDEHIEAFMSIKKWSQSYPDEYVTRTRESLLLQRGGIETVPISKSLSIGFCFIVRELVRIGKLTNHFAHEHCYVPTEGIRKLFRRMGCPDIGDAADCSNSKKIYKFLVEHLGPEDAIFDKYFDIPFHIILSDDQLRIKFGLPSII